MGVGAAVVSADWVALASLWEAPYRAYLGEGVSQMASGGATLATMWL
jgi:hypothetical protein